MKFYTLITLIAFLTACGSNNNNIKTTTSSNTELVVHYDGEEVHRRGGRYINEQQLRSELGKSQELVVIFGADWCKSCDLTRRAIDQAEFNVRVLWLNIDEKWVQELAGMMSINAVPLMVHVTSNGNTAASRVGSGKIITYMVLRF